LYYSRMSCCDAVPCHAMLLSQESMRLAEKLSQAAGVPYTDMDGNRQFEGTDNSLVHQVIVRWQCHRAWQLDWREYWFQLNAMAEAKWHKYNR
jgi:hypothetical protein